MSRDSDIATGFREAREHKKKLRAKFGMPCPWCQDLLPRACPAVLLPRGYCRIHRYRDPRPHLTDADHRSVENELEA